MKFNFMEFLRQLFVQGIFSKEDVAGKEVLLIGDIQTAGAAGQFLQGELQQIGAVECLRVSLFNPGTTCSYLSIADLLDNIGREKYDFVILLGGLEKEKDFVQAAVDIQAVCKPGGKLFVLARTPVETGTQLAVDYYEDQWRYEPRDLEALFTACTVERAVLSEPAYMLGVRFRKGVANPQRDLAKYALYHCRAGRRISKADAQDLGFFHEYQVLDEIGVRFHTDKCHFAHNYLDKYEFFLARHRQESFNLLELGVFLGSSEYMWQEYFPNARIYGVDIDPACHQYATERIHIIQADLSQQAALEKLKEIKPYIIIDDASHLWSHQILALFVLFEVLPSGGIYIIEDMAYTPFDGHHKRMVQ